MTPIHHITEGINVFECTHTTEQCDLKVAVQELSMSVVSSG